MPRVLVIDDQAHVRATVLTVLRANGFEVATANDGKSGLQRFADSQFDLVIVDVYMPELDGVKVIRQLRARAANLPIVAMSGVLLGESRHTALDIFPNASDLSDIVCLKKPFRSSELMAAVEKALVLAA